MKFHCVINFNYNNTQSDDLIKIIILLFHVTLHSQLLLHFKPLALLCNTSQSESLIFINLQKNQEINSFNYL